MVLPRFRKSAGGGRLHPCSETSASVTATDTYSESPAELLYLHSPDPHALTHCRPAQNTPVVCYSHAPCLPPLAFLAPSALGSLCSSSISCLLPNAMPLSYCPCTPPSHPSLTRRLPPPLISGRNPSQPPSLSLHTPMAFPFLASTARISGFTCANRTPRSFLCSESVCKQDRQGMS